MKIKSIFLGISLVFLHLAIGGCSDEKIENPNMTLTRSVKNINTDYNDQTVTSNLTVSAIDLVATNITVTNNAKLTLKGSNSVTINKLFTVEAGCQLEISN
ncbi:hypothetical protein [uncultured Bacteroides sp.]|uniref:hypothetical protein n=1 Tax=uncultured Bacteroides sp. TaxID=162156 RepID=UPI002AA7A449|nr:hypothetical protein [uncultured Bacteroides sp.]